MSDILDLSENVVTSGAIDWLDIRPFGQQMRVQTSLISA